MAYKYLKSIIMFGGYRYDNYKCWVANKRTSKKMGLSQEKLALKAEIDRTYLAGVEQGKRNPSLRSLEKILLALDISFHDFFEGM